MRRQGHLFWVLIGLIVATGIGAGCTPLPGKVTEPTSEPSSVTSPLALPADVSPLLSPPPTPTLGAAPVPPTPTEPIAIPSPPFVEPTPRTPLPPAGQLPAGANLERVVRLAMEDLARRLGVRPDKIVLISVTADEFPASNLGCPSPKKTPLPIPAFVTGQVIVLQNRGEYYVYHARGRQAIFCGRR